MNSSNWCSSALLALGLFPLSLPAGTWSFTNLSGDDTETGIDPAKTYTHLIDFGADGGAATINGVELAAKGMTGLNYSLAGTGGSFVNNGQGIFTDTGTYVSATNTGTSPVKADTDEDGLLDGVESNSGVFVSAANPGSHPLKADSDSDGFNDSFEAQNGYNPNAAASTPESDLDIRTAIEFRFNAANAVSYRIEGSTDLAAWTTVEAAVTGNGGRVTRFYTTENTPIRFYRAQRN